MREESPQEQEIRELENRIWDLKGRLYIAWPAEKSDLMSQIVAAKDRIRILKHYMKHPAPEHPEQIMMFQ